MDHWSKSIPQKLPFTKKTLSKRVVISYILDYVIIIVLAGIFFALDAVEPFHQPFSLSNTSLQYPYAVHERVPLPALFTIAVVSPAIIIAVYTLVIDGLCSSSQSKTPSSSRAGRWTARYTLKDRLWELNCGILGLLLASGTAFVITGALKNATGKPRPDFIARCLPPADATDSKPFGLSNSTICTQTDNSIMKDAFRSFPSGHSSSSWGGLFYLSLYLAGKMHMLDHRGEVWKVFIVLVPTLGAALVAISRIEDARHHPFDVITGSLLGALCAFVSYRQYFPSLAESWKKGRAHPIRSWGTDPSGPDAVEMEKELARDTGRPGFHTAPLPNTQWDPPSYHTTGPSQSRSNISYEQQASPEQLPQQEISGRFDGASVERVQRLRSHSRNDSDLHLSRDYDGSSSEEDYEMQPRYPLGQQYGGANQSTINLPANMQREPESAPPHHTTIQEV